MRNQIIGLLGVIVSLASLAPSYVQAQAEVLELYCPSCGFRKRLVQGVVAEDRAKNVQSIIVVCERSQQVRTIKIPLDPKLPVRDEPLAAHRSGTGFSEILGIRLPRFLVPGNTCPLYPLAAYVDRDVCPLDGRPGIELRVIAQY
jgi:hypothetical protein